MEVVMIGKGYKYDTKHYVRMLCMENTPQSELVRCTVRGWDGEPLGRSSFRVPKQRKNPEPILDNFTIAAVMVSAVFVALSVGLLLL